MTNFEINYWTREPGQGRRRNWSRIKRPSAILYHPQIHA